MVLLCGVSDSSAIGYVIALTEADACDIVTMGDVWPV